VEDELDETAREVFEALRAHRLEVAKREGVAAYLVASDRCLRDIARLRPANRAELMLAHGIGPAKAERYGDGFLAVVNGPPGEGVPNRDDEATGPPSLFG
jgi:ATP-dependent DNA helicase RecQ